MVLNNNNLFDRKEYSKTVLVVELFYYDNNKFHFKVQSETYFCS